MNWQGINQIHLYFLDILPKTILMLSQIDNEYCKKVIRGSGFILNIERKNTLSVLSTMYCFSFL